jgi:membrane fusion protein (multidrug efflux system)
MSVVPLNGVYLVANFKETQIKRMRVGQKASVKVDAIDGREIDAQVESFAPGTGSQFALLPPENATGNFIKIVQRVPVRLRVMPPKQLEDRLLPGLSVVVSVDTTREEPAS